jgi:hypothetical protein
MNDRAQGGGCYRAESVRRKDGLATVVPSPARERDETDDCIRSDRAFVQFSTGEVFTFGAELGGCQLFRVLPTG